MPEIEVFEIRLKTLELDETVLETIDRAIPYPILPGIQSENGVAYSAAFKQVFSQLTHKKVGPVGFEPTTKGL